MKFSLRTRMLLTIAGITFLTTAILIFTVRREVSISMENLERNNAINLLKAISSGVQNEYKSIVFFREQQLQQRKYELKNMVSVAVEVFKFQYEQSRKGLISEEEAKTRAMMQLRMMRYDNGVGYFWVNTIDRFKPILLMHPVLPQLEGSSLEEPEYNCAMGTNENLLRAMARVCAESGGGYVDYLWTKPNSRDISKKVTKISYVELFRPWGMIIGSGLYIEDIDAAKQTRIDAVIKELRDTSATLRIGDNGYLFMFSSDKNMLVHPVVSGKDGAKIVNPVSGRVVLDEIMQANASGLNHHDYYWEKPLTKQHEKSQKRVYFEYFAPLDWYICVCYYMDDVKKPVVELNSRLMQISAALLLFASFIAIVLGISLGAPLRRLTRAAELIGRNGIGGALIPVTGSSETRELGIILNNAFNTIMDKENQLRSSEENLRTILRSIGDAVIATDADGRIIGINPAAQKLTDWTNDEAQGRFLLDVMKLVDPIKLEPVDNPIKTVVVAPGNSFACSDLQLVSRNGQRVLVDLNCSPIRGENGLITGAVLAFRDITEKIRIEQELRQSQKMDSLGQLAGGVAHDFNNMLSAINSCGELIGFNTAPENSKIREYARIITMTCQRAADLTSKLLAFSRKGKVLSTAIDIHASIKDAADILARSIDKRVQIVLDLKAENSTVIGDPSQIQNMIMNLGINAGYAMPGGGQITITTSNVYLNDEDINSSLLDIHPGDYMKVTVEDTGIGISQEIIGRIFEPFFTTRGVGKGTGLGLAAVYGSVKEHHGAIKVWSEINQGTAFTIYLPLAPSGKVLAVSSEVSPNIPGRGCILLVDDENILRITSKALLENLGYDVLLAEDGEDALAVYKGNRDKIDLVILDMVMPKMNGTDCFHALKAINPEVKVLISSGFTGNEEIQQLKKEGLTGFVHKPFMSGDMSRTLAAILKTS